MAKSPAVDEGQSRRERQIMAVIYRRGQATVAEVLAELPDPPGYSAVRAILRVLEEKGHLRHEEQGPRYLFLPTVPREQRGDLHSGSLFKRFLMTRPSRSSRHCSTSQTVRFRCRSFEARPTHQ